MLHAEGFQDRLLTLMPHLNERQLRLAAALEARSLGYGGVSAVAQATGIARGTIHRALEELQHPPLLWTSQSTRQLAEALSQEGHRISPDTVGRLLGEMGYSLQANRKTLEEGAQPSRSGPAVSVPQRPRSVIPEAGRSRDLGRHQEERTHGALFQ